MHDNSFQDNNHNGIPDNLEYGNDFGDDFDDDRSDTWTSRSRGRSRGVDLSGAPEWAKACVWVGGLLAVAGVGIFFFEVLGSIDPAPSRPFDGFPSDFSSDFPSPRVETGPDVRLAFGLFFVGFVLTVIGTLGAATSKRH